MGYIHPANGRWYSSDRGRKRNDKCEDADNDEEVEDNQQNTSKIHCYYDSENDEYYWAENYKSRSSCSNSLTKEEIICGSIVLVVLIAACITMFSLMFDYFMGPEMCKSEDYLFVKWGIGLAIAFAALPCICGGEWDECR